MYLYLESHCGIVLKKKKKKTYSYSLFPDSKTNTMLQQIHLPTVNMGYIKGNQCILITKAGFPEKKSIKNIIFNAI